MIMPSLQPMSRHFLFWNHGFSMICVRSRLRYSLSTRKVSEIELWVVLFWASKVLQTHLQAGICLKIGNLASAIVAVIVSMNCHELCFLLPLLLRLLLFMLLLPLHGVCSRRGRHTTLLTGVHCNSSVVMLLLLLQLPPFVLPPLLLLLLKVCSM